MGMRVLVVDDEALARERLCDLLARLDMGLQVAEAADGRSAYARLVSESWDAVLLDVQMPGLNGLGLAELLRGRPDAPALVFVTAHAEHALRAFELDASDYLTKPVRLERLRQALDKAQRWRGAHGLAAGGPGAGVPGSFLVIHDRGRTERVPIEDILYLKAELKYVTVRTRDRSYIYDGSLHEFERAAGERWLRIHRNALVAREHVRALERVHERSAEPGGEPFDGWVVRLDGVEERLQVSRRQLTAVREALLTEKAAC